MEQPYSIIRNEDFSLAVIEEKPNCLHFKDYLRLISASMCIFNVYFILNAIYKSSLSNHAFLGMQRAHTHSIEQAPLVKVNERFAFWRFRFNITKEGKDVFKQVLNIPFTPVKVLPDLL